MNQALAEAITKQQADDPYIVHLDTIPLEQRLGESQLEAARRQATGGSLRRRDFLGHGADGLVPVPQGLLPVYGCALGRCLDGLARPIHSKYGRQRFEGFVIAWQTEGQARVRRRGRHLLHVENVTGSPYGQRVYAVGADSFTTEALGCEIGAIVRAEIDSPGWYCVQTRTENDPPLEQLLQNDRASTHSF